MDTENSLDLKAGAWEPVLFSGRLLGAYCQRLPEHPAKLRVVRFLARLLLTRGLHVRNKFTRSELLVNPTDAIGSSILREGGYEPVSLSLAVNLMRLGGLFVDVGANFGLYTVPIARIEGTHCISIDASAVAVAQLAGNLERNGLANVDIVNAAVGDAIGLLRIAAVQRGNLGSTRVLSENRSAPGGNWIPCLRLDDVLQRLHRPKPILLLKVDVEGFEERVFESLDFGGDYRPKNILVECDPVGFSTARSTFKYLLAQGYSSFSIRGDRVSDCSNLPENNAWFRDSRT
jgi:FkbM family methyltransferase